MDKNISKEERKYKGRIPSGVRDSVLAENRAKRERSVALKQKKDGTVEQTPKMDLFFEEFLKNNGNSTEAAMVVFNCPNRAAAASLGHYYLKKAQLLGRVYLEQKGFTYGKILEVMAGKAVEAKDPDWMDRVLKMLGYHDFLVKESPKQTVNIIQTEKDIISKYVDGEVEEVEPLEIVEENEENNLDKTN